MYIAQDRRTQEIVAIKQCTRDSLFDTMTQSSMKAICMYARFVGFKVDGNGVLSLWDSFRLYEEGKST